MEIFLWFLLPMFFIFWIESSSELKKLKTRIKGLERHKGRRTDMSRFLQEMIGKKPILVGELIGTDSWLIVDVDEEWVKLSKTDKKGQTKIKLMRIDDIKSVELMES